MFFVKTVSVDTADDSAFQPQGVQEDGNGAALEKGALINGFMAVPVKKDEIVFRKKRLAANAVGDGSAVEDEPCPVGIEGFGCQFFRCPRRAFMGRGGAGVIARVGYIGGEHGISIEAGKGFSFFCKVVKGSAVVAGRIKGKLFFFCVVHEGFCERRKPAFHFLIHGDLLFMFFIIY